MITVSGTLGSRLLGFFRDAALAWLLGSSATADAVTTALRLPYLVRRLYSDGSLSLELTAHCVRARHQTPDGDLALAGCVGRLALCWGLAILVLFWLCATPLIWLIAPGLEARPAVQEQAVSLFRICAGYIPLAMLASVCMALLHGRERFGVPALTGSAFNLSLLVCIGAAALGLGLPGPMVALGVVIGGLAQLAVQLYAIRSLRRSVSKPVARSDTRTVADSGTRAVRRQARELFGRLPCGLAGAAAPQLAFWIAAALTSLSADGSLAALFYAERLLEFPIGLLGAAVGIVAAPHLAKAVAERGDAALTPSLKQALELGLLGSLPATAGLMAVAVPLTAVLFGHGAFGQDAVRLTAAYVCAYAPGLPAYTLSRPLLAACHAMEDRRTPVRALCAGLAATLAVGAIGCWLWGRLGPPLGAALGIWVYMLVLWGGVAGRAGSLSVSRARLARGLAGSALVYGVASALGHWADSPATALLLGVPAGILVYGLIVLLDLKIARGC